MVVQSRARALVYGISWLGVMAFSTGSVHAQSRSDAQWLDPITIIATKTEEKASETLAGVSTIRKEQLDMIMPDRVSDMLLGVPSVHVQERGDDPGTSINIRGLQDFGRVNVVVDGARQNFQRTGHTANGAFFLDPELIGGVDIVRGPTANIYGSGAIGGVASFRTKDVEDVLRVGERWGVLANAEAGSNQAQGLASVFAAGRTNPNVEAIIGGSYRAKSDYDDGNNQLVRNSWNKTASGLAKLTFRPAEFHEVKLGGTVQEFKYDFGQPNRSPLTGSSVYATELKNYTTTAKWTYTPPNKLIDWNSNIYWNRSDQEQVKTAHTTGSQGNAVSGYIGDLRTYRIDTIGFDANNTSRWEFSGIQNALTYGSDAFNDKVNVFDPRGNSDTTTPSGERTVSGAFIQLKTNYSTWLETIVAARYDNYRLEGLGTTATAERLSPKFTVGVTPVAGFTPYVSYAEGYRAPAITETIISGAHASAGGPAPRTCSDGTTGYFCFLPNPNLRPEVGKNKEIGINLRYDNIWQQADSFRGKFNVYQNDVYDYIDLVAFGTDANNAAYGPPFYQYQNIPHARLRGFEYDTMYDAGGWFLGVAGHIMEGKNLESGLSLYTVQPRKVTTTAGLRLYDRKVTMSVRWASIRASQDNLPAGYVPGTTYELVNLYLGYAPTQDVLMSFSVENLLDQYYRPYAVPGSTALDTQNDTLWASPGPGITYKGSLKIRFGALQ